MFNRLYIHVPFCVKKCHYCSFISEPPRDADLEEYPKLLMREWQLRAADARPIDSIYFGGGTPSLLQPHQLGQLIEEIDTRAGISAEAEITLEANPGTVAESVLKEFRNAGINRISLGIQSFDDNTLIRLGRIHTAEQSRLAFLDARNAGFDNISIDLIHSLPGQSLDQWRSELQCAIKLRPEHVSVYGLTIEEGTPFARTYPAECRELADEDLSADMFELADELLTATGFEHYEIANYARHGCRSQHNSGYWKRDGYLGLGVAAHSFLRDSFGIRYSNPVTLEEYRQLLATGLLPPRNEQRLTKNDAMAEHLFLGMRLAEGVSFAAFEDEFGSSLESVYGSVISELISLGLLIQSAGMISLTRRGILLSNQALARFLL